MTPEEWATFQDPAPMLEFLRGRVSERKLQFFACACCRRVAHFDEEPSMLEAVESYVAGDPLPWGLEIDEIREAAAEFSQFPLDHMLPSTAVRFFAFQVDHPPLETLGRIIGHLVTHAIWYAAECSPPGDSDAVEQASRAASDAAEAAAFAYLRDQYVTSTQSEEDEVSLWNQAEVISEVQARVEERHVQANFLRCVAGNPFRRPAHEIRPLSTAIQQIAQGIFEEKAFDRLPILADALEEAGCTDPDILAHCRSEGPHVRGCWVVDLILGKE